MPDTSFAETTLTAPEGGATLNPDPLYPDDAPHARGLHSHAFKSRDDARFVRDRLTSIAALADRGSHAEARGACADLLFDFQPLVAANPDLVTLCDEVLLRCGATALRFRFLLAVHGDAPARQAHIMRNRRADRAPEPLSAMAKQTV
jgi:hypothetical protein